MIDSIPQAVKESGTGNSGYDIKKNSPGISENIGNVSKDFLLHLIVRINIEEVYDAKWIKDLVQKGSNPAADQIEACTVHESPARMIGAWIQTTVDAKKDQYDMPGIGVEGQGKISMVHAAGVKKGADTAKHTKAHWKCLKPCDARLPQFPVKRSTVL